MYKETMTKNEIKARLSLAINLAEQAKGLLDEVYSYEVANKLTPSTEADVFDICNQIQECEMTDINEVMAELEEAGYFKEAKIPEGEEIKPIQIKVDSFLDAEVRTPLLDGDYLETYVGNSDYGPQAGVVYISKDENLIDLVMAEQKQDEYARGDGESGEDITIYSWGDPFSEDYTFKNTISKADIDKVLGTENERE